MLKNGEKVAAIIPARGGSKGIPLKNVIALGDKPLVAWPITLAQKISRIDRIICSTDNPDIAKIASTYGAEVPFMRPAELARDETTSLDVLRHAIGYLEQKEHWKADIILCFYPTCPFLKQQRVEMALDIFETKGCNSVIGVQKDWGRYWCFSNEQKAYTPIYPLKRVNRQYYQPLYREAGNIYFSRYNVTISQQKLVDETSIEFILVGDDEVIDIDTPNDLVKAEQFLKGTYGYKK